MQRQPHSKAVSALLRPTQGLDIMKQASKAALRELLNEKRLVQWAPGQASQWLCALGLLVTSQQQQLSAKGGHATGGRTEMPLVSRQQGCD